MLFGTVSDIQFNQNAMSFGGASTSATLGLDIAVDFSLINTRTYEVKAAFTALGSGQDVKVVSRATGPFQPAQGDFRGFQEPGEAAYGELMAQFACPAGAGQGAAGVSPPAPQSRNEPVVNY